MNIVRRMNTSAVMSACGVMMVAGACGAMVLTQRAAAGAAANVAAAGHLVEQGGKLPAGVEDVQGKITSTGLARVSRAPDHLDIVLGVEAVGATAGETQGEATNRMDAVVRAVRMMGLDGVKLQTGSADLSPRYEERRDTSKPAQILGYRSNITLNIRTTDLKAAARIIDAGLKAGANRVDRVAFGIKEAIGAREEAIRLAASAAKRKAGVMAGALDLEIVGVEAANTDVTEYGGWGNRMAQNVNNDAGGPETEGQDAYVPGTVEVSSMVSVTFITRPIGQRR